MGSRREFSRGGSSDKCGNGSESSDGECCNGRAESVTDSLLALGEVASLPPEHDSVGKRGCEISPPSQTPRRVSFPRLDSLRSEIPRAWLDFDETVSFPVDMEEASHVEGALAAARGSVSFERCTARDMEEEAETASRGSGASASSRGEHGEEVSRGAGVAADDVLGKGGGCVRSRCASSRAREEDVVDDYHDVLQQW